MTPPPHILAAAELVHNWAVKNGLTDYVIGPVCSITCLNTSHSLVKLYKHYLKTQVDPALLEGAPTPTPGPSEPYPTPVHELTPAERLYLMAHPKVGENSSLER
jgi:hypothetical protein